MVNMTRKLAFVLLALILAACSVHMQCGSVKGSSSVSVGAYYYVWWDPTSPEQEHDRKNWNAPRILDEPYIGSYNSNDSTIIKQHLAWLEDLKIDFLIVSWWGNNSYTDNSTRMVFQTAAENQTKVRLCIMIEPYNGKNPIDFNQTYNHIHDNYVQPFPTVYYELDSKPLLLFFNEDNFTDATTFYKDSRFTVKINGQKSYVDWVYHDKIPGQWQGTLPYNRVFPVCPSFDDSHVRYPNHTIDIDYSNDSYINDWKEALNYANNDEVDIITICSWNELEERTAIEPHYSPNATKGPFYLYNLTKTYVYNLKGQGLIVRNPSRKPEGNVQPYQTVTVSVNVTDLINTFLNVSIRYFTNVSEEVFEYSMTFNQTSGFYEYSIQGQPASTNVSYSIIARDSASINQTNDNAGHYFVYAVIPEYPVIPVLLLSMLTAISTMTIYGIGRILKKRLDQQAPNI
jgi:hypothetical protein